MSKRLFFAGAVVMALLACSAAAIPDSHEGHKVLHKHVKKANAKFGQQLQQVFSHASAGARAFRPEQSAALTECVTQCSQTCVDNNSPCGAACAQTCAEGCVTPCVSAASAVTPAPTTDRCATANTSAEALNIIRQCGTSELEVSSFFQLNNHSLAAKAEIDAFCAPACNAAWNTAISTYSDCFPASFTTSFNVINTMCESYEGEFCAWRLRATDQLNACDDAASGFTNETLCQANTTRNRYCQWSNESHECNVKPTAALLQQACTPCYDRYLFLVVQFLEANFGGTDVSDEQRDEILLVQSLLAIQKNYYCAKQDDTWCLPVVESLDERVYNINDSNNVSLEIVRQNISNICTETGKICLNKVAGAQVELLRTYTGVVYRDCLREAARLPFASWRQSAEANCVVAYASTFRAVAGISVDLAFMCRTNAQTGNNSFCNPLAHEYVRDPCFSLIHNGNQCNATCAAWMTTEASRLGCCWDRFAELSFDATYPDTTGLPALVAATFTTAPASGRNASNNPGIEPVEICANVSGNGFNATAVRADVLAPCPTVQGVTKELRLIGVRWNRFAANSTLKQLMESALRSDMARTLGVSTNAVVNGTLVRDETQSLTAGNVTVAANATADANGTLSAGASASASASRRQDDSSSSSTVGTKFDFELVLDSSDETAAAATRFDAAKSANTIQATTTASTLTSECTDCVGSPTAAPGETAAPPPTGNLFAAIVGAPTDGSTNSPVTSGAAGVAATLAVAVVAAVLTIVA